MYIGGTPSNSMVYRLPVSNMELIVREVSALNLGKNLSEDNYVIEKELEQQDHAADGILHYHWPIWALDTAPGELTSKE